MNIALVLSGGIGRRAGTGIPKQYMEVAGKTLISYSLERLSSHDGIDAIHIVADPAWQDSIREWLKPADARKKFRGFSVPGENRQLSILHGLEDIRGYAGALDCVLIHDAARPGLSEGLISACLEAAREHDGVLPVLPMKDTLYKSNNGRTVTGLLNRSQIYAGQAPEVFRLAPYYEANRRLLPDRIMDISGSAEPAVLAGMDVVMIPGDEGNFKITTGADLEKFRKMMCGDTRDAQCEGCIASQSQHRKGKDE